MLLYLYLVRAAFFRDLMHPVLAESWRRRSFVPCRDLCARIIAASTQHVPDDSLLRQIDDLPFYRNSWRTLVGEAILFGCEEMPLVQMAPQTLSCLLAPEQYLGGELSRCAFAPIQQVQFGSRDLTFGGTVYRPDHAGQNDEREVRRLLDYLNGVDLEAWREEMLCPMPELTSADEREEELAYVRDWWSPLVDVYRRAVERDCIVVCEEC